MCVQMCRPNYLDLNDSDSDGDDSVETKQPNRGQVKADNKANNQMHRSNQYM